MAKSPDRTTPPRGEAQATPETPVTTSLLSDDDIHLFNEGTHVRLWERLGSHLVQRDGVDGVHFAVWAPNASAVHVIGDFNGWDRGSPEGRLSPRGVSGIWEGFVPGVRHGDAYKYHVVAAGRGVDKADPYAVHAETPPRTASKVWSLDYEWQDADWMAERGPRNRLSAPMSIYELHLGSWRRIDDDGVARAMSYREIAAPLIEHVRELGFSHVEFLPVMEHPFYGSWGYQVTGYFAATSRYGTPQDLKYLIDQLHQAGIGVILDWVPSHFPTDEWALGDFDGTHLYEHADPRQGFHPDWSSYIFNLGRTEVQAFLLSSALFWLEEYHADGLRVDGVASMLYLDYSREEGEWIPNRHGGNENLEAIDFLRRFNIEVFERFPDVQTFAEESTSWPMVSRPTYLGGLGFGFKWDMGWMHDTLKVFEYEPIHRKYHHDQLTFRAIYAYTENYALPLSHDEVVHGKGSMLAKMPGDEWQRFANLRALYGYQFTLPGKKLLFMGGEFGQPQEWNHDRSLDWHVLEGDSMHARLQRCVADLARLYHETPALHEGDIEPFGFEWIDCTDWESSVVAYLRRARDGSSAVVVLNLTPVVRTNYRLGFPHGGRWVERFNSDAREYGGSGAGNYGGVEALPHPSHGRSHSAVLTLPPLAVEVFLPDTSSEVP